MNCFRVLSCVLVALFVLVGTSGCAATSGGFPQRSENEQAELEALESRYASATRITKHYEMAEGSRRDDRDDVVSGRLALIDANYKIFVRSFVLQKQRGDTATDAVLIGLNTAGAIIVPSTTTQILAGVAAGITGVKASFDKNFYYEQTVKALYSAMNAQRKEVRARILTGLSLDYGSYPLSQALSDLDDYYFAGTFLGALQSIQRDAGAKDKENQEKIDLIQTPTPVDVRTQIRENAIAIQSKVSTLTDQAKRLALITAVNSTLSPSVAAAEVTAAAASVDSAKAWLLARHKENNRDPAKVKALNKALQDAGLIAK